MRIFRRNRLSVLTLRAAAALVAACALAGCDNNLGVTHLSHFNGLPDFMCIQHALHGIPGISIQYHETIEQGQVSVHAWTYQANGDQYQLMVGPLTYSQMAMNGNFLSGADTSPRLRRTMAQVDSTLETICKLRDLGKHMREMCLNPSGSNGDCPPLDS